MVYCRQALRSLGMILSEYLFGVSGSSELIALMLATVAFLHTAPILAFNSHWCINLDTESRETPRISKK